MAAVSVRDRLEKALEHLERALEAKLNVLESENQKLRAELSKLKAEAKKVAAVEEQPPEAPVKAAPVTRKVSAATLGGQQSLSELQVSLSQLKKLVS